MRDEQSLAKEFSLQALSACTPRYNGGPPVASLLSGACSSMASRTAA
jgi:hypothetical protein